jgi:CubicO group peptidase (beta-lactamase class C family)
MGTVPRPHPQSQQPHAAAAVTGHGSGLKIDFARTVGHGRMHTMRRLVAANVVLPSLLLALAFAACFDRGLPTAVPVGTQGPRVTAILDSLRTLYDLPALGAAMVTADSILALDAVGLRRAGSGTPVTAADRFHLGSNLKAMTAGLSARLVDEGLLRWDMPLHEALPDLAGQMRPEYRDRTIADLLGHTARVVRDPQVAYTSQDASVQRLQAVTWALAQPPAASAATYAYSNVGYMIAGLIAERVTGEPFETLITSRLFAPLGMQSVGFGAMGTPGMEDQPWQHYLDASGRRVEVPPGPDADNPPAYGPAGRAHMSLGDWAKYIQAVLRAERGETGVWSTASARRLTTPHGSTGGTGYALGWAITRRNWARGEILTHNGSNTMSFSVAWLAPAEGFAVIVVTNQGGERAALATDAAAGHLIWLHLNGQ